MAPNPSQESLDLERTKGEKMRSIKMPLWRFSLSLFISMFCVWVSADALQRLHALGQKISDIVWAALASAAICTFFATLVRIQDAKRRSTMDSPLDSPTKTRSVDGGGP